jgi:heme-degrading monooxygenase HmoA
MYTRLLTFKGATDTDAGVSYLRDEALPILRAQHGYRGVTASADRANASFSITSLWETEADRDASTSALGKAREEASKIVGGELTVENFELVVHIVARPVEPGHGLFVVRMSMGPAGVGSNVAFFETDVAPAIKAQRGFCSLRNMIDRQTGRGVVGTVWDSIETRDRHIDKLPERRVTAQGRGVRFEETSAREILFAELAPSTT